MIRPALTYAPLAAALVLAAPILAGCAPQSDAPRPTAQQQAACRARADEVYEKQNRGAVYNADSFAGSTRDAPFAGGGIAGNATDGLSGRYARDTMVQDCLDSTFGSAPDTAGPDGPTASAPAATPHTLAAPPIGRALPPPQP